MTNAILAAVMAFAPLSFHPDYRLPASMMALETHSFAEVRYDLMSEWTHHGALSGVWLPTSFLAVGASYDAYLVDIGPFVAAYATTESTIVAYESTARIGAAVTFIRGLSVGVSFEQDIDVLANNPLYLPALSAGVHYDIDTPFLQGTVGFGVIDIALTRTPSFNMTAMAEYRPLSFLAVRYVFEKQIDLLTHRLALGAVFGMIGCTVTGAFDGTSFSVSAGIPVVVLEKPSVCVELRGRYHPFLGFEGGIATSMRFGDISPRTGFIVLAAEAPKSDLEALEAKMKKMESTLSENERKIAALERDRRERMLRRVTIIPFRNGGLKSYDYLKRTVVAAISAQLVKNALLQTIPYDTVVDACAKKGIALERDGLTADTAAFIRDTFASGYAVTGDITVIGNTVRIGASLFAVEDGTVIDMFVENCASGDKALFAALDTLGARIQTRLRVLMTEREKRAP